MMLNRSKMPRYAGVLENPDAVGCAGRPRLGDYMLLSVRVAGDRIVAARFLTHGCPAAIASGEWLVGCVLGKTIAQASGTLVDDVLAGIGAVAKGREGAASLAVTALRDALNYLHWQSRAASPMPSQETLPPIVTPARRRKSEGGLTPASL